MKLSSINDRQLDENGVRDHNVLCSPVDLLKKSWIKLERKDQIIPSDAIGEKVYLCDGFGKTRAIGVISYYAREQMEIVIKILKKFDK